MSPSVATRLDVPLSVLCHRYELLRAPRKPKGWRRLFAECPGCLRPMLLAVVLAGDQTIPFWCCPPCIEQANAMWRSLV